MSNVALILGVYEEMSRKKPLLTNVLEELRVYKGGILLDKTVTIFVIEDDSERVIKSAKLKDIKPEEYKAYKVVHYYQLIFTPTIIEIYVEKELEH